MLRLSRNFYLKKKIACVIDPCELSGHEPAKRDTGRGWHGGKVGVRGEDGMEGRSGCGERIAWREGRGAGRGWHGGKVGVRGEDGMEGRSGCGEGIAWREGRGAGRG